MKTGLIIYSGGMDSTVLLNDFKHSIAVAISFHYGSKHNDVEIHYARKNCHRLGIEHMVIKLDFINRFFKSDLLKSGGEVPEGHYEDLSMKRTVVPFRNGIMLSIAAGIAESNNLKEIYIANHFGDHAIYPDCRTNFIHSMKSAIALGTYANIQVQSPYCEMTKREIAMRGHALRVNFDDTYSCYKGHREFMFFGYPVGAAHCGKCGTCTERKEALKGFDTTEYLDDYKPGPGIPPEFPSIGL